MLFTDVKPVVEATRGAVVESIHYGAITIVDVHGNIVASHGNPATVTFLRSTSKPFQALPFVEMGGPEHYGLTERELAIMCASHIGTDEHVQVIESIQKKVGIREENLLCGTHPPSHKPTREAMLLRGEAPTPNRHNCSGKHSGFIAQALLRSLPIEDYINPDHEIQKTILKTFAEMCNIPPESVRLGIDGCSAPVFAVPLWNAAFAFARLCDPSGLSDTRAVACQKITHAMTSNPDMIAGSGEFDTLLMQVGKGKIVSKRGAEGYQGIGLLPGAIEPESPALGITIKISDGDLDERARSVATIEILRQLGVLSQEQIDQELAKFATGPIYNWRKLKVGELRPVFDLKLRG